LYTLNYLVVHSSAVRTIWLLHIASVQSIYITKCNKHRYTCHTVAGHPRAHTFSLLHRIHRSFWKKE